MGRRQRSTHGDLARIALWPFVLTGLMLCGLGVDAATPDDSDSSLKPGTSESKAVKQEPVVVTGSRLPTTWANATDGPAPLRIITRREIEESGASRVVEVLRRLPEVSFSAIQTSFQVADGTATVALRGLPLGSTLVLINGRRLQSVAGMQVRSTALFNLNYIPLGAVESIEVWPTGSSAIYGADALAGVINIILKKDFSGLEGNVRYGWAKGTERTDATLAYGWQSERLSVTGLATFSDQSVLAGGERPLTASDDKRPFGGQDLRTTSSNPANVYSLNGRNLPGLNSTFAGVPRGSSGIGLTPGDFANTAGVLNRQSRVDLLDIIPGTKQYGLYLAASYQITPSVEVFGELLATRIEKTSGTAATPLTGGSTGTYFVPASSPFNPFGVPVGVDYFFTGFGRLDATETSNFVRPLIGARGGMPFTDWSWELSALSSVDHTHDSVPGVFLNQSAIQSALAATDPAQALNVFQDGPGATRAVLDGLISSLNQEFRTRLDFATGFVRGPIGRTAAGPIDVVLGGEASKENVFSGSVFTPLNATRRSYAAFGEARAPVLAGDGANAKELLTLSGALRYDHFNDFGAKTSPQAGIEIRPQDALLLRASYSTAFRPPSLLSLYQASVTNTGTITDPLRGNAPTLVSITRGGNADLQPTTTKSSSAGVVYSPIRIPHLDISLTWWKIHLKDGVGTPPNQTIISNEAQFPGRVHRAPPSASDIAAGQPGPMTAIDATALNFGTLDVSGIDFGLRWSVKTDVGEFSPGASATYTHKYTGPALPGGPSLDRVARADSTGFAPRWKGIASLGWKVKAMQANLDARYVGSYLDYGTGTRKIGNDWFLDGSVRYEVGKRLFASSTVDALRRLEVRLGGVNLLDKSPPLSAYQGGVLGYDPAQYDIVGRFLYVQLGTKF